LFDHEGTPNDAFAPLSFSLYTEYYLIPWVAIHLIAEDLDCSLETAYEEMIASAESGVMLHPMAEEDKKVEAIIQQHCVLSAEKRVAKIESFREEMRIEVEKAKAEKMRNTSAAKLVNKVCTMSCIRLFTRRISSRLKEFMCRYVLSSRVSTDSTDASCSSLIPGVRLLLRNQQQVPQNSLDHMLMIRRCQIWCVVLSLFVRASLPRNTLLDSPTQISRLPLREDFHQEQHERCVVPVRAFSLTVCLFLVAQMISQFTLSPPLQNLIRLTPH
jgi:hypothetical protein